MALHNYITLCIESEYYLRIYSPDISPIMLITHNNPLRKTICLLNFYTVVFFPVILFPVRYPLSPSRFPDPQGRFIIRPAHVFPSPKPPYHASGLHFPKTYWFFLGK